MLGSESFPARIKSVGLSLANALAWSMTFILLLVFPILVNSIGSANVFMGLAFISAFAIILIQMLIEDDSNNKNKQTHQPLNNNDNEQIV